MGRKREKAEKQAEKNIQKRQEKSSVKKRGDLELVKQGDGKHTIDSNYEPYFGVKDSKDIIIKPREPQKYVKDPDYQYPLDKEETPTALEVAREKNKTAPKDINGQVVFQDQNLTSYKKRITEGIDWNRNTPHTSKYDVNSNEARAARAARESSETNVSEAASRYSDLVSRGVERNKNNPQSQAYDVNSAEAKKARAAAVANGEERLENLYKETGFVRTGDVYRAKDLDKRLTAIENNESVKKTLNFTTRSDGSMSYSSKKDYEAAQKFINEQEAEYVKTYIDGFKNDAKYKLDEKISSFVNNKNWEKEFGEMGAQQKVGLMSNLTEAQINMIKNKGLDLENIANWSEEQMGSVVKGLKEAEYMNDVRENLTKEFREGVKQRANLAGYNKIASRESSVAAEMSKKMSGFKSVGKMAIGGALMYGLISALSDGGGQQSNAQLYGQQPLY